MVPREGFSLKELLVEARADIREGKKNLDDLKEKYDTQSTSIYEKSKENTGDINSVGRKVRDLEKRVSVLELRVYAAVSIITVLGFVVQTLWK